MKHTLYVIEIPVATRPFRFDLLRADDESGTRRPLVWASAEEAEAYATRLEGQIRGVTDPEFEFDHQVVPLTGETGNEDEPDFTLPSLNANHCPSC